MWRAPGQREKAPPDVRNHSDADLMAYKLSAILDHLFETDFQVNVA